MIRKFFNSTISVIDETKNNSGMFIIQVEQLGSSILVEFCPQGEQLDLIPFTIAGLPQKEPQNKEDDNEKANEYLSVVINNDPFGKYSGCELYTIFQNNDQKWIENCLKNMKNEYIRSRVEFLKGWYTKNKLWQ